MSRLHIATKPKVRTQRVPLTSSADVKDFEKISENYRFVTRDIKCIADAPDFIAPEVKFYQFLTSENHLLIVVTH